MSDTPDANNGTLYAKLARITGAMQRVPKSGENKFQHYRYATESDLVDAVRGLMADEKVAIIPRVNGVERIEHPNERLGPITRVYMTFTLACGDTGASIELPWVGDGQDTADKGLYKAYTGAEKYFLMKLFLIATGDDPEQEQAPPPPRQQRQSEPRRQEHQPTVTVEEAEAKFWDVFAPVIGGADWPRVEAMLGSPTRKPGNVGEWRSLYRAVDAAVRAEVAKAEQEAT